VRDEVVLASCLRGEDKHHICGVFAHIEAVIALANEHFEEVLVGAIVLLLLYHAAVLHVGAGQHAEPHQNTMY